MSAGMTVLCRRCYRPLGDGRRAFGHVLCLICERTPKGGRR